MLHIVAAIWGRVTVKGNKTSLFLGEYKHQLVYSLHENKVIHITSQSQTPTNTAALALP